MTSLKLDKWSYNCTNYRRKIGCILKMRYCCPEKCLKYTLLNLSKIGRHVIDRANCLLRGHDGCSRNQEHTRFRHNHEKKIFPQ